MFSSQVHVAPENQRNQSGRGESNSDTQGGNLVPNHSATAASFRNQDIGGAVGLTPTLLGTGSALGFICSRASRVTSLLTEQRRQS